MLFKYKAGDRPKIMSAQTVAVRKAWKEQIWKKEMDWQDLVAQKLRKRDSQFSFWGDWVDGGAFH